MGIINKKQVSHAGIYMLSDILRRSISLIMLPIYTRYLTPADYGVVELLSMLIDFSTIVFGARVGQAIFRFYCTANTAQEKNSIISSSLFLGFSLNALGAFFIIIFSGKLSLLIFSNSDYQTMIALFAITMLLMPLIEIPLAHIRAQQKPWLFFTFNITKLALQLSLNIYFVVYKEFHVQGVIYSAVISSMVISSILATYSLRIVGLSASIKTCKKLFNFSLPLKVATIGSFYLTFGDRYILSMYSNLEQVGLYALGYKFGFIFTLLAWTPFERMWDTEKYNIYKNNNAILQYQRIFIYINSILIFLGLCISIFSKDLLIIMSAPSFHDAYKIVPIIILAYILQSWTQFCNFGILLSERTIKIAHAEIIATIIITAAYFLLIPKFGIFGAAWATVIGFFTRFFWINHHAKITYDMKLPWKKILTIALPAILVFSLSLYIPDNLLLSITLRSLLILFFILLFLVLPILTKDEKKWIWQKLKTLRNKIFI